MTFLASWILNAEMLCWTIYRLLRKSWSRPRRCRGAMKLLPISFMNCVIDGCEGCEPLVIASESASPVEDSPRRARTCACGSRTVLLDKNVRELPQKKGES